jgi:DNA repair protein RadD
MNLRPYQQQALDKMLWSMSLEGNDICVVPTAGGKSLIIASLANSLNRNILILQPTKEILEQNYEKMLEYVPKEEIGIYSASMNSRDVKKYTFATIGSIYKVPELFQGFGVVIVDECNEIPIKNLSGMYGSFFKGIGKVKIFGFTATPYRLDATYEWNNGELTAGVGIKLINRMKPFFWSRIIFNLSVAELLEQKYLCPPTYIDKSVVTQADLPINASRSDYDLFGVEVVLEKKKSQILQAIEYSKTIAKSILVFCVSVKQAQDLQAITPDSAVVTAKTDKQTREQIIKDFRGGKIKVVFNCSVMTRGFDYPALECVILARPTQSLGLYVQMVGRVLRISEGKKTGYVIDLTNTVRKLGRVETIKIDKIENKWDIVSETGAWHNKQLYKYVIPTKKTNDLF